MFVANLMLNARVTTLTTLLKGGKFTVKGSDIIMHLTIEQIADIVGIDTNIVADTVDSKTKVGVNELLHITSYYQVFFIRQLTPWIKHHRMQELFDTEFVLKILDRFDVKEPTDINSVIYEATPTAQQIYPTPLPVMAANTTTNTMYFNWQIHEVAHTSLFVVNININWTDMVAWAKHTLVQWLLKNRL